MEIIDGLARFHGDHRVPSGEQPESSVRREGHRAKSLKAHDRSQGVGRRSQKRLKVADCRKVFPCGQQDPGHVGRGRGRTSGFHWRGAIPTVHVVATTRKCVTLAAAQCRSLFRNTLKSGTGGAFPIASDGTRVVQTSKRY